MKHTLKKQKQRGKEGKSGYGRNVGAVSESPMSVLLTGPHPPIAFLSSARAENPVSSVKLPEELQTSLICQ